MGNIEIFDTIANKYDTAERMEISKIIAGELRKHIINGKEKTAIDYGCGTGLVGMELLNELKSVMFVDASKNMIELVKQKIDNSDITNAEVFYLDLESSLDVDRKADYIFLVQVLLHVKDIEPLLSNLYQSLNKDGHLLLVDFDYNESIVSDSVHNGFKQQQLIETLEKIGFVDSSMDTFYHGSNIFMNKDASLFLLDAVKVVE